MKIKFKNTDVYYDFKNHEFVFGNNRIDDRLTPAEQNIFCILVENKGCVVTLDEMAGSGDEAKCDNVIRNYIKEIRKHFAKYNIGKPITTVRGVGYKCEEDAIEFISDTGEIESSIENGIITKLKKIVETHPDTKTYAYIRDLHDVLLDIENDKHKLDALEKELNHFSISDSENNTTNTSYYFTLYYLLSLYCKRNYKLHYSNLSLDGLIKKYKDSFADYPLSLEILSWQARRGTEEHKQASLKEAFGYDKILISHLDLAENAGVFSSFASTVAEALESEYISEKQGSSMSFWNSAEERTLDWQMAKNYMPRIIEAWKKTWNSDDDYGKHHFIWGKLILFSADMHILSSEERKKRIDEANEQFAIALECEPNSPDSERRRSKYTEYKNKCSEVAEYWKKISDEKENKKCFLLKSEACTIKNKRDNLNKPNEDFFINDAENFIYLIADGVTRPHMEYSKSSESLAAKCAESLCKNIKAELMKKKNSDDIAQSFLASMKKANSKLITLQENLETEFYPCATFIGAIIKNNTLFFSNIADTIGILIRNDVKITLSESHNALAEKKQLEKSDVYEKLHNNKDSDEGFGIFNGNPNISYFLHVCQISLLPNDRIILASDGLADFLRYERADKLKTLTKEEILEKSCQFDQAPFNSYADDKTIIIIDIDQ